LYPVYHILPAALCLKLVLGLTAFRHLYFMLNEGNIWLKHCLNFRVLFLPSGEKICFVGLLSRGVLSSVLTVIKKIKNFMKLYVRKFIVHIIFLRF
jgi:hypothetical protein